MITSKEKILKNIRNALITPTINPFPSVDFEKSVYPESKEDPDVLFAKEFTNAGGNFIYCQDKEELIENLNALADKKDWKKITCLEPKILSLLSGKIKTLTSEEDIFKSDVGITSCEALIVRTGSIIITSGNKEGRGLSVIPPVHIIIAYPNQFVFDIKDALSIVQKKYDQNLPSMISLITGPSRTADIEKTLVLGAHGPKEVYLLLLEE